jgi:hypothetical protein
MEDPSLATIVASLTINQLNDLELVIANNTRAVLRELLGTTQRWRPSTHPISIDGEPPNDTTP